MIKIKLERWKEIVRLEVVEGDAEDFVEIINKSTNFRWDYYKNDFIIVHDGINEAVKTIEEINRLIEQYNNSIKDDDYILKCNGCRGNCMTQLEEGFFRNMTECGLLPYSHCDNVNTNWQKINDNKIEIIE